VAVRIGRSLKSSEMKLTPIEAPRQAHQSRKTALQDGGRLSSECCILSRCLLRSVPDPASITVNQESGMLDPAQIGVLLDAQQSDHCS
jgi:hypothetical protein